MHLLVEAYTGMAVMVHHDVDFSLTIMTQIPELICRGFIIGTAGTSTKRDLAIDEQCNL